MAGNTTNYLWDEYSQFGDVILESNAAYQYERHYTLANGMLISQTDTLGSLYFLADAQGSTRALTDGASGAVTSSYTYDAFGNLDGNALNAETHYLYTGQQFDPYTELYSLRARYYDPSVGRFSSRDTWAYNYQNPMELNRYVYTANNPIRYTDPSGYQGNMFTTAMIDLYVAMGSSTALRFGVGATVGGLFGAAMGGLVAVQTYDKIAGGYCGSRSVQGVSRDYYVRAAIVSGAFWGALIGGVGAAGGGYATAIVSGILLGTGLVGLGSSMLELKSDSDKGLGLNYCAVDDAIGSILALVSATQMGYQGYQDIKRATQARNQTIEVFNDDDTPPRNNMGGSGDPTTIDAYKQHLDYEHLDAARRELGGEVIKINPRDGLPYDHVTEVRNAQRGVYNRIQTINGMLSYPKTDSAMIPALTAELAEASALLDYSKNFVPFP